VAKHQIHNQKHVVMQRLWVKLLYETQRYDLLSIIF
jgi:hypothetical protein